jgi:hypothetical protein
MPRPDTSYSRSTQLDQSASGTDQQGELSGREEVTNYNDGVSEPGSSAFKDTPLATEVNPVDGSANQAYHRSRLPASNSAIVKKALDAATQLYDRWSINDGETADDLAGARQRQTQRSALMLCTPIQSLIAQGFNQSHRTASATSGVSKHRRPRDKLGRFTRRGGKSDVTIDSSVAGKRFDKSQEFGSETGMAGVAEEEGSDEDGYKVKGLKKGAKYMELNQIFNLL